MSRSDAIFLFFLFVYPYGAIILARLHETLAKNKIKEDDCNCNYDKDKFCCLEHKQSHDLFYGPEKSLGLGFWPFALPIYAVYYATKRFTPFLWNAIIFVLRLLFWDLPGVIATGLSWIVSKKPQVTKPVEFYATGYRVSADVPTNNIEEFGNVHLDVERKTK